MSRKHHYIKCETQYYQAIEKGLKKFEIRKNDRDYKKYDIVHICESFDGQKTGRGLSPVEINYIMYGGIYGLDKDYCVFCWK